MARIENHESARTPVVRLLVVDDHVDTAAILADLLRDAGYDVAVAYDAVAALALASSFRPALAVLDVGLPVMDGYALAHELRMRLAHPLGLVAVSGYGKHPAIARGRAAEFDVHLAKPIDFDELVTVLGQLAAS